jgi:hypothetical protein
LEEVSMTDTATVERPAPTDLPTDQPAEAEAPPPAEAEVANTEAIEATGANAEASTVDASPTGGEEAPGGEAPAEPEKPAERGPVEVTLAAPVYIKLVEALVDPLDEGGVEAQEEKLSAERRDFLGAVRKAKKTAGKEYVVGLDVAQQDEAAVVIAEIRAAIAEGKVKPPSKMNGQQFDRAIDKLLREIGHGPAPTPQAEKAPRAPRPPKLDADGNPIVRKQGQRPELTVVHGKKGYTVYDERSGGHKAFGHTDEAEVVKFIAEQRAAAGEGKTVRAHMLDWTNGRASAADSFEKEL